MLFSLEEATHPRCGCEGYPVLAQAISGKTPKDILAGSGGIGAAQAKMIRDAAFGYVA
jgi:hypothetical protein